MTYYLSYITTLYRLCKDSVYEYMYTNEEKDTNLRIFPNSSIYDKYTTFFSEPTFIIDNIYIGSAYNAANLSQLESCGIKTIINMTNEVSNHFPNNFIYGRFGLYDNNNDDIEKYLDDIIDFIEKNSSGNILIHCKMGASRSAAVILYYLTKKHNMTLITALDFIKSKRNIINPNNKFIETISKFDK